MQPLDERTERVRAYDPRRDPGRWPPLPRHPPPPHPQLGSGVVCDECGTTYNPGADRCPTCMQRRRRRGGGLEAVTETVDGDRPWTTVERSDALDGTRHPDMPDDAEGWPW